MKVCACHQNRFNKSVQKIREADRYEPFWEVVLWDSTYQMVGSAAITTELPEGNMGAGWRCSYESVHPQYRFAGGG